MSDTVVWIGVKFQIAPRLVTASIPEEKLKELLNLVEEMLWHNVVSITDPRSFAGKDIGFWAAMLQVRGDGILPTSVRLRGLARVADARRRRRHGAARAAAAVGRSSLFDG